jgi:hypothetical protein
MQFKRISTATVALAAAWALGGCAASRRATTVESGGEVAPSTTVVPTDNRTIPVGAQLVATLDQSLGTNISNAGDTFTATVSQTLYAGDGSVVVPMGARVDGQVTAISPSNNAANPALIRLDFSAIRFNGQSYPFAAAIVQSSPQKTSTKSSADQTKKIVIGGAVGAALGGLLSKGDLDKVVIGGAVGAALGSVVSLGTSVNATLPAGSSMTIQATQTTVLR